MEVQTAFKWGKTPSEFFALSEMDRAYMMAYCNNISDMQSYDDAQAEARARMRARVSGKGGGRG